MAVKTRVIRIGNSQGVRIPKTLLEQANLGDEVELEVRDGKVVIRAAASPRDNWNAQFSKLAPAQEDDFDLDFPNEWDENDWEWQ